MDSRTSACEVSRTTLCPLSKAVAAIWAPVLPEKMLVMQRTRSMGVCVFPAVTRIFMRCWARFFRKNSKFPIPYIFARRNSLANPVYFAEHLKLNELEGRFCKNVTTLVLLGPFVTENKSTTPGPDES